MKKALLFMLFLTIWGAANAQVRIGGNTGPHSAAILDLNTSNELTPAGNKRGLALPRISLTGSKALLNETIPPEGMLVYNTGGALRAGIYLWDGTQWLKLAILPAEEGAGEFRNVPLKKTITEVEPMKGIVFWATNSKINDYKNSITLEFSYCLYSDVVNKDKGEYDWAKFDELLKTISDRGHQAVVRFRYEYPGSTDVDRKTKGMTAVPAYIKKLDGYTETYNADPICDDEDTRGEGPTYYADWRNDELKRFTKDFFTKFAELYDNDPRLAFVQVGFGHWSEYHICGTDLDLGVNFPAHDYQKDFLQHVNSLFVNTPWSISIDAADITYTPIVKDATLMALPFGVFDDTFMQAGHDIGHGDGYNERCWNALNRQRWQFAPGGGEFSYGDQQKALDLNGIHGGTWEQRAAQYKITYMLGDGVSKGSGTVDRVKEASMASGYRFQITAYQVSGTQAKVKIKNTGIAPLYHNAYITIKGVRSKDSLKGLLPGVEAEYIVEVAIDSSEEPDVTITSNKILAGRTIPYEADL